jgi:L-ascorbate metabolism protein UlaG (beta-lactamase superfamily)
MTDELAAAPASTPGLAPVALLPVGGPTVLIDIAGLRLMIDPTFDAPQSYPVGARSLRKTAPGALALDEVGRLDHVLLSHDQHPDNLDHGGRELVSRVPTLTTAAAAQRLGGTARALPAWTSTTLRTPDGRAVTVTGVPAQHGPDGTEHLTGPVIGFVLTTAGPGMATIYVSGDNASLDVVREVASAFPHIDLAVLFAGAARTPLIDGTLTLTSEEAVEATRILGGPRILPVHTDGWAHFTENHTVLEAAFDRSGLSDLLLPARPGFWVRPR